MNFDQYYEIGSSHKICQDFAIAGKANNLSIANLGYAIVCDGCSMSGDQIPIDTGARLLALSIIKNFEKSTLNIQQGFSEFEGVQLSTISHIIEEVNTTRNFFNLSTRFFDATMIIAISDGYSLNIYSFGDGGFFIKERDTDIIKFVIIEYDSGAPFYLSYCLSEKDKNIYMKEFGDKRVFVKTYWIDISKKEIVASSVYSHMANDANNFSKKMWTYNSTKDIECVGVFSDGIQTFMKEKENIPFAEIASEFSSFRNYNGKFVERRLANGLVKKCRQEGIHHFDDISCAVIHFGQTI